MTANPPIYDALVIEHGDVVAEAREAADDVRASAEILLDWTGTRAEVQDTVTTA